MVAANHLHLFQTLCKMNKEVKVWQSKFKNLAALSDLKIKVTKLKNELAWALVAEKERVGINYDSKHLDCITLKCFKTLLPAVFM